MGIAIACVTSCRHYPYYLLLMIPMIVDGTVQKVWNIESNNLRRFITGLLGGIGIIYVFISIHKFTVWWELRLFHWLGWL